MADLVSRGGASRRCSSDSRTNEAVIKCLRWIVASRDEHGLAFQCKGHRKNVGRGWQLRCRHGVHEGRPFGKTISLLHLLSWCDFDRCGWGLALGDQLGKRSWTDLPASPSTKHGPVCRRTFADIWRVPSFPYYASLFTYRRTVRSFLELGGSHHAHRKAIRSWRALLAGIPVGPGSPGESRMSL